MHALRLAEYAANQNPDIELVRNKPWFQAAVNSLLINGDGSIHPDVRVQLISLYKQMENHPKSHVAPNSLSDIKHDVTKDPKLKSKGLGVFFLNLLATRLQRYGEPSEVAEVQDWIYQLEQIPDADDGIPKPFKSRYDELNRKYLAQQIADATKTLKRVSDFAGGE